MVWYDTRDDPSHNNVKVRTYIATSVDGGRTFGPNIPVADGLSDEADRPNDNPPYVTSSFDYAEYIGVAVDSGVAHVVWSDNNNTLPQAAGWFSRNPAPNSTLTFTNVINNATQTATWTFVDHVPVPGSNQTQIGAEKSATLANLVHDLNASTDPVVQQATYVYVPGYGDLNHAPPYPVDNLIIQAKTPWPSGGQFTLDAWSPAFCDPGGQCFPAGCAATTCFINWVDQGLDRLVISLNLKTDQVPIPITPGDRMVVMSGQIPGHPESRSAGRILRYEGKSGAFINEFVPNCLSTVFPPSSVNCASVPGAAENPIDMVFGPDRKLYVADTPIGGGTYTTPSGLAVKRYNGRTGAFEEGISPEEDDPYARFISYGSGRSRKNRRPSLRTRQQSLCQRFFHRRDLAL